MENPTMTTIGDYRAYRNTTKSVELSAPENFRLDSNQMVQLLVSFIGFIKENDNDHHTEV